MDLITALKNGMVQDIPQKPVQQVETVMSDVFIYEDVVRKVFKHNKPGIFLDLTNPEARLKFNLEDFSWNQSISPDIHTALHGVRKKGGTYTLCDPEDGEAWFIEMDRVNDSDTLFNRLLSGTVNISDAQSVARNQTEGIDTLTKKYIGEYQDLVDHGLSSLWEDRLDQDLRSFGKILGKEISAELTDQRIDRLLCFMKNHKYFRELSIADATITIDNHAANIVFHKDKPQFIDIFLIKREWRLIDSNNNIARIAACARALGNNDLADSMYEAYSTYHQLAPTEITQFQEAYNSFIKGYYYTHLKRPEIARKYFTLADKTLDSLSA